MFELLHVLILLIVVMAVAIGEPNWNANEFDRNVYFLLIMRTCALCSHCAILCQSTGFHFRSNSHCLQLHVGHVWNATHIH